jgi:hypothetical protein
VIFLLDIVMYCCILYNMIFNGKDLDINILMLYLNLENNGNNTYLGVKKNGQ